METLPSSPRTAASRAHRGREGTTLGFGGRLRGPIRNRSARTCLEMRRAGRPRIGSKTDPVKMLPEAPIRSSALWIRASRSRAVGAVVPEAFATWCAQYVRQAPFGYLNLDGEGS